MENILGNHNLLFSDYWFYQFFFFGAKHVTVQKEILCGFLPFSLNSAKKMESVTAQVTTVKRTLRQREAA